MALSEKIDKRLTLVFEDGLDPENGEVILKSKNFNNVKITATPDQLHEVANTLVPLQQRVLHEVKQNETSLITAE